MTNMYTKDLKILLIEDNPGDARLIEEMLKESGPQFKLEYADKLSTGIDLLRSNAFDVILLDLGLPDSQGLDTLAKINKIILQTPVIVLTGLEDDATSIEAVKEGAQDYLVKGQINDILLARSINYAVERKKVEVELAKSEAMLMKAQELGRMGSWEWDIATNNLTWSKETYIIYGLDHGMGAPKYDLFINTLAPECKNDFLKAINDTLKLRRPFDGEYIIIRPDGTRVNTHTRGEVVYDSKGNPVKMYGMVQDITESRRAEKELQYSEFRLIRAQKIAHLADWEYDIESDRFTGSDEAYRIFNIDWTTELSYGLLREMSHPDDRDNVDKHLKNLIENGMGEPFEYRVVRSDGSMVDIRVQGEVIRDGTGKVAKLFGTFYDITGRKQAEEKIIAKNRELSIMYSVAAIAAESFDRKELLQVVLRELTTFIGVACGSVYLIDEDAGNAILRVHQGLSAEYLEKARCLSIDDKSVAAVLGSKRPFVSQEPRFCKKYAITTENERNIKNVVNFSLRSHEKVIGFVELALPLDREISDDDMHVLESVGNEVGIAVENVRLFEETKKAYDELKTLDVMKNDFISNVSHELKTPLVLIKGYTDLMCDESFGALNEKQLKAMEVVSRNSERLRHLIDSLIYLTMEKAKKVELTLVPLQIVDVIKHASLDVHPIIEKKGLTITLDMPDELPKVSGDVDKLTEVMINLIDNAIKFTPKGGEITIAAYEEPKNIHITVKDTGVGIPKDVISKLFDRFYQADASTTRRYGGTGLGLHISKSIVEMHNGKIWAESEKGVGTTIHVLLHQKQSAKKK